MGKVTVNRHIKGIPRDPSTSATKLMPLTKETGANRRKNRNGYEKPKARGPAKPQKAVMILKGTTKPMGPNGAGVGVGRENYWKENSFYIPGEYLQGNRGCRKSFEREGS